MKTKWSYRVEIVGRGEVEGKLNSFGYDGWELVSCNELAVMGKAAPSNALEVFFHLVLKRGSET